MNPISHVKLFRAGRLPNGDEPIVVVTFEQTREEDFFAEYFILYQKSQRPTSCRYLCKENAREFLEIRTPEKVVEDVADYALAEIEGKLVESRPEEEQFKWIRRPAYTLTPIGLEDLRALWFRGRIEEPIREMARITRSAELKDELNQILNLPRPKYTLEKLSD